MSTIRDDTDLYDRDFVPRTKEHARLSSSCPITAEQVLDDAWWPGGRR